MDETKEENTITPREYQLKLAEHCVDNDAIAVLPTGSGKTLIAVLLINNLVSKTKKKAAFIVNKVVNVEQQYEYIKKHLDLKIEKWQKKIRNNQIDFVKFLKENDVIILTADAFERALTHAWIKMEDLSVIVIDECHHSMAKSHPCRLIVERMKEFKKENKQQYPRFLGLTASGLNGKVIPNQLTHKFIEFEITLGAKVITSNEYLQDEYRKVINETVFFTDAYSEKIVYEGLDQLETFCSLNNEFSTGIETDPRRIIIVECVRRARTIIEDCGLYCGYVVIEHDIIPRIKKMIDDGINSSNKFILLSSALTLFENIHAEMKRTIGKCDTYEEIKDHLHPRVSKIIEVLEGYKNFQRKNGKECCAIIFAQKCDTVMALALILQKLAKLRPSFIKAAYAVGSGVPKLKFSKENSDNNNTNLSETVKNFRDGKVNCLVATQVLEEGIDIPSCNLVICTHIAPTFCSYIQSRGRARASSSLLAYIVSQEDRSKYIYNAHIFKSIEKFLLQRIATFKNDVLGRKKAIYDVHHNSLEESYTVESTGASITMSNAIGLVHLYCSQLPSDIYTPLSTKHQLSQVSWGYICKIELPTNSPVQEKVITGRGHKRRKHAYMSAALETCKVLHKHGELDDNLVPYSKEKFAEKENFIFYDDTGTTRKHRLYDKKVADVLTDNLISVNKPFYVYIVEMNLLEKVPDQLNPKKRKVMDFKNETPHVFGLCTSKKFPEIPTFPVFEKYGKLIASVKLAPQQFIVSMNQLQKLQLFHGYIFSDILGISHQMVFEPTRAISSTLVIPMKKSQNGGDYDIDYEVAEKAIAGFPSIPTEDERKKFVYNRKNFEDAVVKPWYRDDDDGSRLYFVEEVTAKDLNSKFDAVGSLITFKKYYQKHYELEAYNQQQNMLAACRISKELNCLFPPHISMKNKDNQEKEHLVPEFVLLHPMPASYRLMLNKIPSVLYRINHLLLADELRHKISCDISHVELDGLDYSFDYNTTMKKLEELPHTESFDEIDEVEEDESDDDSSNGYSDGCSDLPVNDSFLFDDSLDDELDMDSYDLVKDFETEDSLKRTESNNLKAELPQVLPNDYYNNEDIEVRLSANILPEHLKIWSPHTHNTSFGVQPALLLQALTTTGARDGFNLERLETIGDSFLKLITTIYLYQHYTHLDEGRLTLLRSLQICNANLLQLGCQKGIASLMVSCLFEPKSNWIPPCFNTVNELSDDSMEDDTVLPMEINVNQDYNHYLKQRMSDKSVADCVEALIGAHLTYLGPESTIEFMKWLGLKVEDSTAMKAPIDCILEKVGSYEAQQHVMSQYSQKGFNELEKTIGYTFRDKSFLVQAFIHLSCRSPLGCYQRLEFLGDAVLDFLITQYLYNHNLKFSPGLLTDLRSALVNNVNFASLIIKHEIHNYLIFENEKLSTSILKFSYLCKQKGDLNFHDMMELVVENDADEVSVEEVECPKALGDIFESLAGAVYLDSGMNIEVVWQVFYNLMEEVISKWCQNPPKPPVRELFENYMDRFEFVKAPKVNGKACVMIKVDGNTILSGVGKSARLARRSAAIEALKYFHQREAAKL